MRAFDILCVAIVALSLGLAFVEGALEVSDVKLAIVGEDGVRKAGER